MNLFSAVSADLIVLGIDLSTSNSATAQSSRLRNASTTNPALNHSSFVPAIIDWYLLDLAAPPRSGPVTPQSKLRLTEL